MNFNAILKITDVTDASEVASEPVTVQEMKDYMRLEGFVDADESTTSALSNFDEDDTHIENLIVSARQTMEEKTGLALVAKTLEVVFTNLCGMQELPGPVGTVLTFLDYDGDVIDVADADIIGQRFVRSPRYSDMTITYTAGETIPEPIRQDIMRLVAYMYEHRGDDPAIAEFVGFLAANYSRNTALM